MQTMSARRTVMALMPGIAVVVAVAACTGAPTGTPEPSPLAASADPRSSGSPPPVAPPTVAPRATMQVLTAPPATPSPSPRILGQAVYVTGWQVCMPPGFTITGPDASGTSHVRDGGFTCTDDMTDPRVSGTTHGEWQMDAWGEGLGNGAIVQWSRRMELSNDGGAWVGTYAGFYTPDTGDNLVIWYKGIGGYEGLSYVQWIEAPPGHVTSGTEVLGLIFPGDLPPTVTDASPAP